MRISKKILAIALSILMAVSMMPFTVFASDSVQTESSVASITNSGVTTYYDTFEEALADVPENGATATIIKLLATTTITSTVVIDNGKNVKISLNNQLMTSANVDPMFRIEGGKLETSGKGTIESTTNDCTIFRVVGKKDADAQWSKLLIGGTNTGNSNCTTVISKEYGVLIPSTNNYADGVYVEVKGIIQSGLSAIYTNGNINKYGTNPATIKLTSTTSPKLICTDNKDNASHDNAAIYAAGYADWTLSSGTITGPTALYAKCGNFSFGQASLPNSKATFTGNGDAVAYSHNGNGITATGDAVVFESCAGYCDVLNVNIINGSFSSANADPIGTYAYSQGADEREEIDNFVSGGIYKSNGTAADVSKYYTDALAAQFEAGDAYIENDELGGKEGTINKNAPGAKVVRGDTVLYAGNVIQAANYCQPGETVIALQDLSNGSQHELSNSDVTIDLNGHTINSTSAYPIRITDGASVTIENGTVTNPYGVSMVGDSSLVIAENCTVNGNISNYDTVSSSNATVDIYGTINGTVTPVTAGTEVNIYEGAAITAATAIDAKAGTTVNVYGGTVTGDVKETGTGNVEITGGTFTDDVEVFLAEGAEQDPVTGTVTQEYVAKIGSATYATLAAAVAAANDGDTITLVANTTGDGISVPVNKFATTGIVVDFDGHKYTCNGNYAGSTGTKRQVFQLNEGNKITFKDGTIESAGARMLIQNYSDLTLDNMILNHNGHTDFADKVPYALSNNAGNVTIKDTTINACSDANAMAFDACRYATYNSVNVTVTGSSVINGNIEMSASANDAKDGLSINLVSGTLNGDIVLDASAAAAMEAAPDKAEITKASTFDQEAPAGYIWKGEGTQTLVSAEANTHGYSLSLTDSINMNLYVSPKDYNVSQIVVNYNDPEKQAPTPISVTYAGDDLNNLEQDAYGRYKITVLTAAAQIMDEITVEIYDEDSGYPMETIDEISVKGYCDAIIADEDSSDKLVDLAKAILDYGKAASDELNYNESAFTYGYYNTDDVTSALAAAKIFDSSWNNHTFYSFSYVATAVPALRLLVTYDEDTCISNRWEHADATFKGEVIEIDPVLVDLDGDNDYETVAIDVTGIMAEDLDEQITVSYATGSITLNALAYAAMTDNSDMARSIYNYYAAAKAYFKNA